MAKSKFVKRECVKLLKPIKYVMTPDGIGTLLGRADVENPEPETDTVKLDGDMVVMLTVQFMGRDYKADGVYHYPSNLVEAVE